jgi:predicted RNA binding protein YcfA (HicA-like mRNA interferase family)
MVLAEKPTLAAHEGPRADLVLKKEGWRLVRQRGSHRQFTHPTKPGVVTVAGSPAQDLHPKTAASAMKQAGLLREP